MKFVGKNYSKSKTKQEVSNFNNRKEKLSLAYKIGCSWDFKFQAKQ
jgi:hypothetical protein